MMPCPKCKGAVDQNIISGNWECSRCGAAVSVTDSHMRRHDDGGLSLLSPKERDECMADMATWGVFTVFIDDDGEARRMPPEEWGNIERELMEENKRAAASELPA